MKRTLTVIASLLLVMAIVVPALAEPVVVNYVSMFPQMHGITRVLRADLGAIAAKSNGKIAFRFRGGPEAMKVPAMGMGVRTGAIDMAMISPDFYGKMVKGTEMLSVSALPAAKHRESGLYDFLNSKFNPIGIQFLMVAPKEPSTMFHFFSNKPIKTVADFKGLSLAGTGIFDTIGPDLGMTPVAMGMPQQYSAMEKGIIDVCRGGIDSVMAFKFYEVAKYIIKPGFGSAPASLLMNKKKFDALGKEVQDYFVNSLYAQAPISEKKHVGMINGAQGAATNKFGMKVIELQDKDEFLKIVNEALYKNGAKDDPETGKKIYELTH